jgi:hypothetical protein
MGRGRSAKTVAFEQACVNILKEVRPASVRGVAYQLFNRKLIPNMSRASTQKVSRILTDARRSGTVPWSWIVDETRGLERKLSWADPDDYAATVARSYRKDRWAQQSAMVEVWSEKGTVRGVLQAVLDEFGVGFRVMHGFSSETVIHDVAVVSKQQNKTLHVLYVGDFDPSGLYMSELDLPRRLARHGAAVKFQRIALLPEDLYDASLRDARFPAETKRTDSRHTWFVSHHGDRCLELDALSPVALRGRVATAIEQSIDREAWDHDAALERVQIDSLNEVLRSWPGAQSV